MREEKYKNMKTALVGFGRFLALSLMLSVLSFPALAGSCDEARKAGGEVRTAWDNYQKGMITRKAYNRTYARFMRWKKKCLASKASGNNSDSTSNGGRVALAVVRPNGFKSRPYKLYGKKYYIEVSGAIGYKGDPKYGSSALMAVDACYLFGISDSPNHNPSGTMRRIFKNSGGRDVCAGGYNPKHVYRSKPFFSKNSYRFWIDNSPMIAKPTGGFLTVSVYEAGQSSINDNSTIAGTRWEYPSSSFPGVTKYVSFHADGTLTNGATYSDTAFKGKGTWRQTGNKVYVKFNNGYAEWVIYLNGNVFEAMATNLKGKHWNVKARRKF